MSTIVNFKKIVEDLNQELALKYKEKGFADEFSEFDYEDNHHYFILEKDSYGKNNIGFLNMTIYNENMYEGENHNEKEVIEETKKWFNKYLDTLAKLKF